MVYTFLLVRCNQQVSSTVNGKACWILHSNRVNKLPFLVMEVIRHAELIVEWFLWTIEHTNRSLDNSNATFRPSRASSGIQVCCMPDEARDGRNVAFELSSDLLVCSIVQRNHSTPLSCQRLQCDCYLYLPPGHCHQKRQWDHAGPSTGQCQSP